MEYDFDISSEGLIFKINMFETFESKSNWLLMQYTGLKDKNGKEVYEGDIIKDELGIGVVRFKAPQFIVYEKDNSEWALGAGMCYPEHMNQLKVTEVIGNIYENPNLLTP